jgi:hypothetical protein
MESENAPDGFYVVGVTATCKRIAFCATPDQAARYIDTLPQAEQGIYYIDGPCTEPVTVDEVSLDDLPADTPEED